VIFEDPNAMSLILIRTNSRTVLSRVGNGIGGTRVFLISDMHLLNLSTELSLRSRLREYLPASLLDLRPCTKGAPL
jgi:hypothetical protein